MKRTTTKRAGLVIAFGLSAVVLVGAGAASHGVLASRALVAPAAAAVPPAAWSAADCSWARTVLTSDTQLDLAEAQAVAGGADARYGSGPALVAYYQQYGAEWKKVNAEVSAVCSDHMPTADQVADALAWFYRASEAHRADTAVNPGDADWNTLWMADYQRLGVLFSDLPR